MHIPPEDIVPLMDQDTSSSAISLLSTFALIGLAEMGD